MHLVADRLQKKFGAITAVADVSFTAVPGQVLGLLGPNGAGKSTTISMLAGLTKPDSGSVTIDGVKLGTGADPSDLPPDGVALSEIAHLPGVTKIDLAGTELSVSAADLRTAAPRVLEGLAARGFSCQELTSRRANLEDVFLSLTGRTMRDT